MSPKLSVIITAKDKESGSLKMLLHSISLQTFKDYELDIVTEGDSESAKAIGIRRARGEYICILSSDNYLNEKDFFALHVGVMDQLPHITGTYPGKYYYYPNDNMLNRYFSLMGCNDPVPFYLNKCDKSPYFSMDRFMFGDQVPTIGDNGFFVRRELIMKSDLDHYYHIDNCEDLRKLGYVLYVITDATIWHRTANDFANFFRKRLHYADRFNTKDRRWKMVRSKDIPRLLFFIFATLTLVQPLWISIKGYRKIHDKAWFLHLPVCWATLGVYGIWTLKRALKRVFSFVR